MFRKNSWSSEYHNVQVEVMSGAVRRSAWGSKMSPEAMFRRGRGKCQRRRESKGDWLKVRRDVIRSVVEEGDATFGGLFTLQG